jgi:hypothetical protein
MLQRTIVAETSQPCIPLLHGRPRKFPQEIARKFQQIDELAVSGLRIWPEMNCGFPACYYSFVIPANAGIQGQATSRLPLRGRNRLI